MLEHAGLARALRQLAESAATAPGRPAVAVELDGWSDEFRTPVDGLLFAAAREPLSNVVKHADATSATVTLSHEHGSARLVVADNGRGIDAEAAERSLEPATSASRLPGAGRGGGRHARRSAARAARGRSRSSSCRTRRRAVGSAPPPHASPDPGTAPSPRWRTPGSGPGVARPPDGPQSLRDRCFLHHRTHRPKEKTHVRRQHLQAPSSPPRTTRTPCAGSPSSTRRTPLAGRVLIGEIAGSPAAALSLGDDRVIADPFRRTDHLVACLRIRAGAVRAHEATPSLSERVRAAIRTRAADSAHSPDPHTPTPIRPQPRLRWTHQPGGRAHGALGPVALTGPRGAGSRPPARSNKAPTAPLPCAPLVEKTPPERGFPRMGAAGFEPATSRV